MSSNKIGNVKDTNEENETNEEEKMNATFPKSPTSTGKREYKLIYINFISLVYVHVASIYGLYVCFVSARWETIFLNCIFYTMAVLGVTAGAHRLWSHRTYKAKMPLQILLMLFNCAAAQRTILKWARDHRLHHKHSDTDADPHNASRGLFYSHIGWLMVRKHPEAIEKGKLIDTSDLTSNPVLKFQAKYSKSLIGGIGFVIPTLMPLLFWKETFMNSWHVTLLRYAVSLNVAFTVNSAAHRWGYRPYNGGILPSQSILLSMITMGEAFHNYHHAFPWDYRTAELGNNLINISTKFIDFFALIGWAYELKSASCDTIKSTMRRRGDGSNLWGKYNN